MSATYAGYMYACVKDILFYGRISHKKISIMHIELAKSACQIVCSVLKLMEEVRQSVEFIEVGNKSFTVSQKRFPSNTDESYP